MNNAESLEFGHGSLRPFDSFGNHGRSVKGAGSYMATLATCSSSLAIRRSWRMTRSLSDLNSRSTSSSLSSIFWSETESKLDQESSLHFSFDS